MMHLSPVSCERHRRQAVVERPVVERLGQPWRPDRDAQFAADQRRVGDARQNGVGLQNLGALVVV